MSALEWIGLLFVLLLVMPIATARPSRY